MCVRGGQKTTGKRSWKTLRERRRRPLIKPHWINRTKRNTVAGWDPFMILYAPFGGCCWQATFAGLSDFPMKFILAEQLWDLSAKYSAWGRIDAVISLPPPCKKLSTKSPAVTDGPRATKVRRDLGFVYSFSPWQRLASKQGKMMCMGKRDVKDLWFVWAVWVGWWICWTLLAGSSDSPIRIATINATECLAALAECYHVYSFWDAPALAVKKAP